VLRGLPQHVEGARKCDGGRRLLLPVVLRRCLLLMLILQQAVDLEPVGAPSIAGTAFGHAHHDALPQPTRLARRPVLLVDDALPIVLALRDGMKVVVRPSEE
jgi:hypothetical protein